MSDADKTLDEAKEMILPEGEFESEVWLSTDGKHTVHVTAKDEQGRKAAGAWAVVVYDKLKERYGTKQGQAKMEYSKDPDLGECAKCGAPNKKSVKTGRPYCSALCWTK